MFIQVKLLKGYPQPLWYRVPSSWPSHNLIGALVQVPLRNQKVHAVVLDMHEYHPAVNGAVIKEAYAVDALPQDPFFRPFLQQIGSYYQLPPQVLLRRVTQFLGQKEETEESSPLTVLSQEEVAEKAVTLTAEQEMVCQALLPAITQGMYAPTVLHGVTGSGKTEVYKKLIVETIAQGKMAVLLVPEVTLALQFERLLRAQLPPSLLLHTFHSATSKKNKHLLWQALQQKKPMLILGVHLPIMLPLPQLGLIIVDEEHEVGYQEKQYPKINSKEMAIWRAQLHKIPVILGSATPSVASLYNVATRKDWRLFELKQRFCGAFPTMKLVLLKNKEWRPYFWITRELQEAIRDRLAKKEQSIIFINRRGYSFFVQCQCSFIFECHQCSISLTLHDDNRLACHYCGMNMQVPSACTKCKASEKTFLKKGIGTQQLVKMLQELFPLARIARADMDAAGKKKEWQKTMHDFAAGELDILVGTQIIAKGYHFPKVTLVGMVWADLNLHFPVFNAAETMLQQLIQVAGRAGRQHPESLVIVQTMAEHRIFQYVSEQHYRRFYDEEIKTRALVGYPPCKRLILLELKSKDEATVEKESVALAAYLREQNQQHHFCVSVLGPALPPVHKIQNVHSRVIYVKGDNIGNLVKLYQMIDHRTYKSLIVFTPSPVS